jgi:hypothetical protein
VPAPPERKPRRSFTDAEKHAIVIETERPGATVSQVGRAHRIVTSMLFRWRAQLGFGKDKTANLVAVRITTGGPAASAMQAPTPWSCRTSCRSLPVRWRSILLMAAVFAPAGSDPEAVRQYVREREENARC